jgi:anti-sigma regulatory factor (Ser/Thr protein kinase)
MSTAAQTFLLSRPKIRRVLAVDDPSLREFMSHAEFSPEFDLIKTTLDQFLTVAFRERFDLIITSPRTTADQDLELLECLQKWRGDGVKVIIIAPHTTAEDVIAALRAHAFALFSVPFDYGSFITMVETAISVPIWSDGIEVISAKPDWISLRVRCSTVAAERLLQYGRQLKIDIPTEVRETVLLSFRELLLNAMEHGGRFNPTLKVDVGYLRTDNMILYYLRDPGAGFDSTKAITDAKNSMEDPLGNVAVRIKKGLRPGGFGIHLANQMVDSLVYNEYGNEVVLIKNLR